MKTPECVNVCEYVSPRVRHELKMKPEQLGLESKCSPLASAELVAVTECFRSSVLTHRTVSPMKIVTFSGSNRRAGIVTVFVVAPAGIMLAVTIAAAAPQNRSFLRIPSQTIDPVSRGTLSEGEGIDLTSLLS